jgi:hypothetical protein
MLIWPRVVCGSTAYHLAHLVVCVFPSCLGAGDWQPGGSPDFSVQREVEILFAVWRCGGVKVLPLLSLACKVCIQRLSKISFWEAHFLLPPSNRHFGILLSIFFMFPWRSKESIATKGGRYKIRRGWSVSQLFGISFFWGMGF